MSTPRLLTCLTRLHRSGEVEARKSDGLGATA